MDNYLSPSSKAQADYDRAHYHTPAPAGVIERRPYPNDLGFDLVLVRPTLCGTFAPVAMVGNMEMTCAPCQAMEYIYNYSTDRIAPRYTIKSYLSISDTHHNLYGGTTLENARKTLNDLRLEYKSMGYGVTYVGSEGNSFRAHDPNGNFIEAFIDRE